MVKIPEDLARAIQSCDCVLWVGASLGSLAARPSWEQVLRRLVASCPEDDRDALTELIGAGRLRTVLTYVHRRLGDEPLAKLLVDVAQEGDRNELAAGAQLLAELPWRACFATIYSDVAVKVLAAAPRKLALHNLGDVHRLSLRDDADPFILRTPPTGRAMRADRELFDLVEEAVHTRTILFLGFEPDDPDLAQILDLLDRIGRGNQHFAILPWVARPQAEELRERYGVDVIPAPAGTTLPAIIAELARACGEVAVRPSDAQGKLAVLDLARAVRAIDPRADLAVDAALALDVAWIEHLMDELPSGKLAAMPAATRLRTGNVVLAHGRIDRARRCFQGVVTHGAGREFLNLAHFNLAMCALLEGDRSAALDGFATCAEVDRSLALVPPRYHLREVLAFSGGTLTLLCSDRETKRDVEISVATLSRPVGHAEQQRFHAALAALAGVDHPAVKGVLGGFADGRLFGSLREPTPGFVLADSLDEKPMPRAKALEIVEPLIDAVEACHARSVLHRAINPGNIVLGPNGPLLRGFGFPPVFSPGRPLARVANRGYMAPEQLAGGAAVAASDVYSIAALLYRLLSGGAPAGAVPPVRAPDGRLDPRLDDLLRSALHPNPSERPSLGGLRERLAKITAQPPEVDASQPVTRAAAGVPEAAEEVVSAALGAKLVAPQDPDDLEAWALILERRPTHVEAREAVARIERDARAAGRWDRVAEALRVRAQQVQVARERIEMLRDLAGIYERELGAPASSFTTLRQLFDHVPVAQQVELVADLRRLAEITGKWSELADCLGVVAERTHEPARQADLQCELGGVLAERLGGSARAVAAYEKAAELRPSAEIYGALVSLYRKLGHDADLARALLSLADLQRDGERHATLCTAAKVLRESLGDEEGALGVIEVVLAENHDYPDAVAAGESLARALGRKATLVDMLARRAAVSLVDREAVEALREAADAAQEIGERERAIELLQKLVTRRPDDHAGAERLVTLLREAAKTDPHRRIALIDALASYVDHAEGAAEKCALLAESATLLDQEVDGKERAVDCRERVLELLPIERPLAREAASALERWYRRQNDRTKLITLLRRQAEAADGEESLRAEAWRKLLALHDEPGELGKPEAIEALERLCELEPGERKWRDALLDRYLAINDYRRAGPLIRAQVDAETDPKRKAELLLRGGILRQEIGKTEGAVDALEEAVRLDPLLTSAWLELRELYANNDQPLKAIEAQVAAARSHGNRVEKVKLMFDAGRRYVEELDKVDRGLPLLEEVVELDPDHRDATGILLERLVAQGDMARAWPHAQIYVMQVRAQQPNDSALNLRALSWAGRCALAVANKERAREYLEKARVLDGNNLDVLRLLGDLDMEASRFAEALKHYQSVVLSVGDTLAPGELSRLYVRMADARLAMGEKPKAVQMFERALDVDPDNADAAARLAEIADVAGPAAAVKAKRRLVELLARKESSTEDPELAAAERARRIDLLGEIASLHAEGLANVDEAVRTLHEVLELTPDDPAVLHRMLDLYTAAGRWRDAVGLLGRLAEAQKAPEVRAKYLFAGAMVIRDHLAEHTQAIEWLQRVLESDPGNEKGFAVLVELLEKTSAWHELSRALRTKMKALPPGTPPARHVDLFTRLGGVYERLGDGKTALAAFHQAARLAASAGESEDRQRARHEQVIKLAVAAGEDNLDKAVTHAHAVIALAPMEFETYHRLVELYLAQNRKDRARCVARTLKFLKQADEAEVELAASGPVGQPSRGAITRELWRTAVAHPSLDWRLSDMFAVLWQAVAFAEGRTPAHHRVRRDARTEVSLQSPIPLSRFLAHACQVLDAPVPDLYLREDELGGLKCDALCDGEGSDRTVFASVLASRDAMGEKSESVLQFRCGRTIARLKPELILSAVLTAPENLRHAAWGGIVATHPDAKVPTDCATPAARYAEAVGKVLSASRRDQLAGAAAKLAKTGDLDARAWLTATTYTVTRAGFVMCADLDVAAAQLTREGDDGNVIASKDRVRDLVAYSVSEPYLRLRKELGVGK